jgi:glycosyltransferase involved in cell wall biosynthesis
LSRPDAHRVAIDATALHDGSQFRGIGTYLRQLLAGLSAYDDIEPVLLETSTRFPWARDRLRHDVVRAGAAVFHSPAQSPPKHSPVPWVHTLHDLTPLVFRHPLLAADRRHWQRVGPRLRDADAVICVSQSSAAQARDLLGVDASRLRVVPLGVSDEFTPDGPARPGGPYLLWASSWGPHKGLELAALAVARLAEAGFPHRLAVTGYQDAAMLRRVHAAVAPAAALDRVDVLGRVADLAPLYRGASALLVTSRAEGFGLPALEAMACGCPVVAFANTSLPEVLGAAGTLVADGDLDAFVDAVAELLSDDARRAQLSKAGIERAKEFTWDRTVAAHVEVYRSLAGVR